MLFGVCSIVEKVPDAQGLILYGAQEPAASVSAGCALVRRQLCQCVFRSLPASQRGCLNTGRQRTQANHQERRDCLHEIPTSLKGTRLEAQRQQASNVLLLLLLLLLTVRPSQVYYYS